jgi:hypothetical protein
MSEKVLVRATAELNLKRKSSAGRYLAVEGRGEAEGYAGLRGNDDVAVAGVGGSCGTGSGSGQAADGSSTASAGDAADNRAEAGASADEACSSLTTALGLLFVLGGVYADTADAGEFDAKRAGSFEAATALGGDYRAGDVGATGEYGSTTGQDGCRERATEGIADLVMAGAEALGDDDGDAGAGGNGWRRGWGGSRCLLGGLLSRLLNDWRGRLGGRLGLCLGGGDGSVRVELGLSCGLWIGGWCWCGFLAATGDEGRCEDQGCEGDVIAHWAILSILMSVSFVLQDTLG